MYRYSWQAFAERFENRSGTSPAVPPPDLAADRFGNLLIVDATAYLAVHDPGRTLPDTREGLRDGILNHAASHWAHSADRPEDRDGTITRRAAAMAALAGADNETDGAALLHHVPDLQEATIGVRMAWARWYQRFSLGPRFWNPLEPDLLGEHLVATTLAEFPGRSRRSRQPRTRPHATQPLIILARIGATSHTTDAYPGFQDAAAHAF